MLIIGPTIFNFIVGLDNAQFYPTQTEIMTVRKFCYESERKWLNVALRKKCLHSELFQSVFPHIRTEYGEILRISVRMWENTD